MYLKSTIYFIAFLISFTCLIHGEGLFDNPESIIYDSLNERYFVANPGNNTIVQVDLEGNQSSFASGLNTPLGLLIVDNFLYCAGIGEIYVYDITTDQFVSSPEHPGAPTMLNGLAADTSRYIYASDYTGGMIYQFNIAQQEFVNTLFFSLDQPNGLCFDIANNRLLIVENNLGDIVAVDLATHDYNTVFNTTYTGCDGLTQSSDGDYYLSSWTTSSIHAIDSSFTQPEVLLFGGFSGPADISYDKTSDILAVPNYLSNSITLIEMKYKASCDTTYGAVPFDINFTGQSEYDIASWHWDFGDGNSSGSQSPLHTYTAPGFYTATMQIVTTADDTLYRKLHNIIIHADTLKADTTYGEAGQSEELIIHGNNTVSIDEIIIPVEYNGSLPLTYDSFSTAGCRTDYFETVSYLNIDAVNKRFVLRLKTSSSGTQPPLPSGDGALLKLYFSYHSASNPSLNTTIYLDGYSYYLPTYTGQGITYTTEVTNGHMTVLSPSCCVGIRGNIDNDPLDQIDISDLVFFVSYSFNSGAEPPCMDEADVDGSGGEAPIDISDIVALVGFMFQGGAEPANCS